ncbi:MAG TPA: hypothetical protein VHY37_11495 [Tepidisphaeraceae bacterium]|nr:hypothetical protein [Tepidisphaeraceae bacterium]
MSVPENGHSGGLALGEQIDRKITASYHHRTRGLRGTNGKMEISMARSSRPMIWILAILAVVITAPLAMAADKPRTVNLIPLIDVGKDAVKGKWTSENGAIVSGTVWCARLRIPYSPPAEYDFHIKFVRRSGKNDIVQIFETSGHECMLTIGGYSNTTYGLCNVNGMTVSHKENPTAIRRH